MDLDDRQVLRQDFGLPRTRGDGPAPSGSGQRRPAASPHTRGWTSAALSMSRRRHGFPAHAGMDPEYLCRARPAPRLPRTRGDGPRRQHRTSFWSGASPHTRGWTRRQVVHVAARPGFPAHAGMDLNATDTSSFVGRLPRTRGDGPSIDHPRRAPVLASPHTRGWTRGGGPRAPLWQGFPAHAGMDPPQPAEAAESQRLPRTRGDGPFDVADRDLRVRASPHTRGWTRRRRAPGRDLAGFPAHAGMDRS